MIITVCEAQVAGSDAMSEGKGAGSTCSQVKCRLSFLTIAFSICPKHVFVFNELKNFLNMF